VTGLVEPSGPEAQDDGFGVDITEVALTCLDGGLVIESWHPGHGHAKSVRD
jgi:hypothetical protein